MLRRREMVGWFALVMMIVLPLAAFGATPEFQKPQIATPDVGATRIDWLPQIDYERLVLTVSGPVDLYLRQEFGPGQAPYLSLVDSKGGRLADGVYTYELRAVPRLDLESHEKLSPRHEREDRSNREAIQSGERPPARALVQSGFFSIKDGSFVTPSTRPAGNAPKPPLRNATAKLSDDELIITGNSCLGSSCASGDADYSALKIRSTQPNIQFQDEDLIGGGGGSSNDWGLLINPFTAAQFSIADFDAQLIPFSVIGGAPDNSLFIDSNGNVGLGTATPSAPLHLQNRSGNTNTNVAVVTSSDGQTLARLFETTNTGGLFSVFNSLEAETVRLSAEGSSWLAPVAGNVGIGTASPTKRLTVKSSGGNDDVFVIQGSSSSTSIFRIFETTSGAGLLSLFDESGSEPIRLSSVSGGRLGIGCNTPEHDLDLSSLGGGACNSGGSRSFIDAGSTTFTASSSRSLKENLRPVQVPDILDKISAVGVYNYDFIKGPKDKIGLMAEDFHTIFDRGSDKMLNGQEVEMALWLAVQELTAQNKELTAKNREISKRLAQLEARLAAGPGNTP